MAYRGGLVLALNRSARYAARMHDPVDAGRSAQFMDRVGVRARPHDARKGWRVGGSDVQARRRALGIDKPSAKRRAEETRRPVMRIVPRSAMCDAIRPMGLRRVVSVDDVAAVYHQIVPLNVGRARGREGSVQPRRSRRAGR